MRRRSHILSKKLLGGTTRDRSTPGIDRSALGPSTATGHGPYHRFSTRAVGDVIDGTVRFMVEAESRKSAPAAPHTFPATRRTYSRSSHAGLVPDQTAVSKK